MLEIMGKGYVIDHCISFFKKQQKDLIYRVYITDVLRTIAGTKNVPKRFYDLIEPAPIEKRTADQIKKRIQDKF